MANFQEATAYCERCQKDVLIRRPRLGCAAHVLLTFFTAGAWLLIYLVYRILETALTLPLGSGGWRCTQCGLAIRRGRIINKG